MAKLKVAKTWLLRGELATQKNAHLKFQNKRLSLRREGDNLGWLPSAPGRGWPGLQSSWQSQRRSEAQRLPHCGLGGQQGAVVHDGGEAVEDGLRQPLAVEEDSAVDGAHCLAPRQNVRCEGGSVSTQSRGG